MMNNTRPSFYLISSAVDGNSKRDLKDTGIV